MTILERINQERNRTGREPISQDQLDEVVWTLRTFFCADGFSSSKGSIYGNGKNLSTDEFIELTKTFK
ncbi:MAG: hypothetical protein RBT45_06400 [Acholeplasmataceae bacterium]|jgi:hypothetical protein|nr:hypothetical protein [Acholeplasmataceae bacterium]